MELRTLGNTGLVVSPIGLGMAALGRPGYINLEHAKDLAGEYDQAVMEHRAHSVLDAAWDAGIRYFDAARSYGLGERFLGSWLSSRAISAETITVGSKWGYTYTADWNVQAESHEIKEHSLATLQRQWRESVALLNGYMQVYQIHSATVESGVLEKIDVLRQLACLRSQGVHIGVSVSGPGQAETVRNAMEIDLDGLRLFETVQATWNLLEPSVGPALSEARAAGIGVIIKEALANGRLTDRNSESGFRAKLALLQREAIRRDSSIDALVLASCLAQPFADVVLSGATTLAQALSNVASCRLKVDEEVMTTLATFAEPSQQYWATRKELLWNRIAARGSAGASPYR